MDPRPAPVEGLPPDDPVARVATGFYNTLVACKSGALYCAGENQNRQCGVDGPKNVHSMRRVEDLRHAHIVQAR